VLENPFVHPIKWAVGLVSGILLYSYLLLAGREKVIDGKD